MPAILRRTYNKGYIKPGSRQTRIQMGQNPERPFRIRMKNLIPKERVRPNPWWWITHRRGVTGRPKVGEDPKEMRAVPKGLVKGTLPERIVYNWLVKRSFIPDVDFDFQSSLQGGRLELGGIVVDFLFPVLKICIQVQGPTHGQHRRMRKDEEQTMMLAQMGYFTHYVDMDEIYDEPRFEERMRRIFNMGYQGTGNSGMFASGAATGDPSPDDIFMIYQETKNLEHLFGFIVLKTDALGQ